MQRQVRLSKGAYLWEEGDGARSVAVVESGRLGVGTTENVIGIVSPGMVLGENSIFALAGESLKRSASVFAVEDDTLVSEYPAAAVKRAFETAELAVPHMVLTTLVGQICRNCVLVITAQKPHSAVVDAPLRGLAKGIVESVPSFEKITDWETFFFTFRFLCALRDQTDELRAKFVWVSSADSKLLDKASDFLMALFQVKDVVRLLEPFIQSEKEMRDWLESSRA
jgi:hypothetical protein